MDISEELNKEKELNKKIESEESREDEVLKQDIETDIDECEKIKDGLTDKILSENDFKKDDRILEDIKANENLDKEIDEDLQLIKDARRLGLNDQADAIESELRIKEEKKKEIEKTISNDRDLP